MSRPLQIYDLETGLETRASPFIGSRSDEILVNCEMSSGHPNIVGLGTTDKQVYLADLRSLEKVAVLRTKGTLQSFTFLDDGTFVHTFDANGFVYVFDVRGRKPQFVHQWCDQACTGGTRIASSVNSSWIACGSDCGFVNVYQMTQTMMSSNPVPDKSIANVQTAIDSMAFHPASEMLCLGSSQMPAAVRLHRSLAASSAQSNMESSAGNNSANSGGLRPIAALVPYFTRVVVALTRFCPNNTADLESTDELRDFRDDVHDLMQDILGLVGAETIFVELYNHVQQLQMLAVSSNAQVTALEVLHEAEACLFMMTTVAKRLSPHDPEGYLSNLISGLVLPGLSAACPFPLQEVGCILYMELSHWAACHPQLRRQIVAQLIGIVEKAAGVEAPNLQPGQKLAVSAALSALGSLASVYRATPSGGPNGLTSAGSESLRTGLLDDHWQDLVQRVAYNLPRLAWVPVYDATNFFAGIGRGMISSIGSGGGGVDFDPNSSRQAFPSRLAQICSVSLECLDKLMTENIAITGTDTTTDPRVWLDYLAALFRTFGCFLRRLDDGGKQQLGTGTQSIGIREVGSLAQSAQTCLSESLRLVREVIWPVVARVLTFYSSRARHMEHTCRLIRFIVRCFSVHLRDLLPEIAEKIVVAYRTGGQHSSFLYLASVLVDEFGEQPDCRFGLVRVYEALGGPTLKLLDGPALSQNPHTVEDLYRLCTRLVQRCPVAFLTSEEVDFNELCNVAVRSLGLYCTGPGANDDITDTPSSNGDPQNNNSSSSASAAAARFLIDLLCFTGQASEVTPTQVAQIISSGGQLATPSCPSAMAAQRVLVWLIQPVSANGPEMIQCGGQRLVSAVIQACCLGISEERFPEMADILHQLNVMTKNELFLTWLNTAVTSLPILRADGLVHATMDQINDFKESIMKSSRSSTILQALSVFAVLFR
ncbi:transportin-3 [Clonorchis sinensis]|uniref:Transportin-3 n=1 Tax=Clonorchis sinensis TaxID=79923 RepID=G7YIN9_CLOSI|nr:transportin-3 [Clonorchis sinensis]